MWGASSMRGPVGLTAGVAVLLGLGLVLPGAALADAPPAAAFDLQPEVAEVGQPVTFTDRSTDDGRIVRRGWDINGDGLVGVPDGPISQSRPYDQPGCVVVFLDVTDDAGQTSRATKVLTIVPAGAPRIPCALPPPPPPAPVAPNGAPSAGFGLTPSAPRVGEQVTFSSTSTDADGTVVAHAWDLDGDGAFDDATAPTAQVTYATEGPRTVSLRVTDDDGAVSTTFRTVAVAAASPPGVGVLPKTARSPARRLDATIRIRGLIFPGIVRVQLLSVTSSRGSTVQVRCAGRGCPFASATTRIPTTGRALRIRRLERSLRPGTVIRGLGRRWGRVGKSTRFRIRRGAAPARHDGCARHGSVRPVRCPQGS